MKNIESQNLILRPFTLKDANIVQALAGAVAVAETTLTVPHPYEDGMAEGWISKHLPDFERGLGVVYAITSKTTPELFGCISLLKDDASDTVADIGYWIGVPYWGLGLCTEATKAIIKYGFNEMKLDTITAHHMHINPASGKVMQKSGMIKSDFKEKYVEKAGEWMDVIFYEVKNNKKLQSE